MAFVRRRKARSGGLAELIGEEAVSTTLVESYRDKKGRPRHRILTNLYGEETPLAALAKLAGQRDILKKRKAELRALC